MTLHAQLTVRCFLPSQPSLEAALFKLLLPPSTHAFRPIFSSRNELPTPYILGLCTLLAFFFYRCTASSEVCWRPHTTPRDLLFFRPSFHKDTNLPLASAPTRHRLARPNSESWPHTSMPHTYLPISVARCKRLFPPFHLRPSLIQCSQIRPLSRCPLQQKVARATLLASPPLRDTLLQASLPGASFLGGACAPSPEHDQKKNGIFRSWSNAVHVSSPTPIKNTFVHMARGGTNNSLRTKQRKAVSPALLSVRCHLAYALLPSLLHDRASPLTSHTHSDLPGAAAGNEVTGASRWHVHNLCAFPMPNIVI